MPVRARRSARVLLLDEGQRVLLLRFVIARSDGPYEFWAAPGGEVQPGETDSAAASRELFEELGLRVVVKHPERTVGAEFEYQGFWNLSTEVFFAAHWDGAPPVLVGIDQAERTALREWRWWTADSIRSSVQPVFPADLAEMLCGLSTIEPCRTPSTASL